MSRYRTPFIWLCLVLVLIWVLLPLYWTIIQSFKTDQALFGEPTFIPKPSELTLKSYFEIFRDYPFTRFFLNSFIISIGSVILSLGITTPGAYAVTRLDFPGRKFIFYALIISIFFPWIVLIIPLFQIFNDVGLYNTYIGVIVAYTVVISPVCLWLLNGFFRSSIDKDLEDAARIDGTSKLGAFFRIIIPLSMPAIIAVAVFTFLIAWNEFIWVFLLTSEEAKRTAVVGLHYMMGSDIARDWNALLAALFLTTLPPMLFYGFLQRFLSEAFATAGGKKG